VSTRRYEDELRSEQTYVTGLYARLDAERARAKDKFRAALAGDAETLADRDSEVRAVAKEVKRLNVADEGCASGGWTPFRRTVLHRPHRPVRCGKRLRTAVG